MTNLHKKTKLSKKSLVYFFYFTQQVFYRFCVVIFIVLPKKRGRRILDWKGSTHIYPDDFNTL
jgi:hypothetical protein